MNFYFLHLIYTIYVFSPLNEIYYSNYLFI